MRLARTVILVDRELESATQTIANILEAVDLRVEELAGALPTSLFCCAFPYTTAESFRQQGNDPKARFTWYAHGLVRGHSNSVLFPVLTPCNSTTIGTIQNEPQMTPNTGKPMILGLMTLSWRLMRQR
jgi:hypothetical protein